jgi:2'-5' RNA ligase
MEVLAKRSKKGFQKVVPAISHSFSDKIHKGGFFMKVGVVIYPSKKLQDFANSYRKRYDPYYALIPPHITLKAKFESSDNEIAEISNHLEEIARNHQPFSITTKKISTFHPVNNVVYLKIEPSSELEKLYGDINSLAYGNPPEYAFVPHITLGQELSDGEHTDVYSQLRLLKLDLTEEIDRFHLVYQLDNGVWNVYETFLLGEK